MRCMAYRIDGMECDACVPRSSVDTVELLYHSITGHVQLLHLCVCVCGMYVRWVVYLCSMCVSKIVENTVSLRNKHGTHRRAAYSIK
jgi:hypothetical protein